MHEDVTFTKRPTFSAELIGNSQLIEGQSAHFETRLEPMGDPSMTVEWYFNGRPLTTGMFLFLQILNRSYNSLYTHAKNSPRIYCYYFFLKVRLTLILFVLIETSS